MADGRVDQEQGLQEVWEEEEHDLGAGDEEEQLADGTEHEEYEHGAPDPPMPCSDKHAHVGEPVGRLVDQLVGPIIEAEGNEEVTIDGVEHEVRPSRSEGKRNDQQRDHV